MNNHSKIKQSKTTFNKNCQLFKKFGRNVPILTSDDDILTNFFIEKQRPFLLNQKSNFNDNTSKPSGAIHDKIIIEINDSANFKNQLSCFLKSQEIDQLEVSISEKGVFGYLEHFTKPISVEDFINYSGSLKLYVAQLPIFKKIHADDLIIKKSDNITTKSRLNKTIDSINLKAKHEQFTKLSGLPKHILNRSHELEYCNIWINLTKNKSLMHFDLYDNYLYVIHGTKTVYLLPPDTKNVEQKSIFEDGFHQVKLQSKKIKKHRGKNLIKLKELKKIILYKGEILRIPEGWYHYVVSEPNTIALNFWFKSIFQKYSNQGNIVSKKLVLQNVNSFLKKEIFIANHQTKGSNPILTLLESAPDTLLRNLVVSLISSKKLQIDALLSNEHDLKNLLIIETLTSRLEGLDRKTQLSQHINQKGTKETGYFNEKDREMFYEFFSQFLDEQKASRMQELKILFRKKIGKFLLKNFGYKNQ